MIIETVDSIVLKKVKIAITLFLFFYSTLKTTTYPLIE